MAAPTPTSSIQRAPGSWVFAARVGLELWGDDHVEMDCSAAGSFSCSKNRLEVYKDRSFFMLGLDALVHVSPGVRAGLGYQLVPHSSVGDSPTYHVGHEHQLGGIVEGVVPATANIALAVRAQGGLRMLVVGGDLADKADDFLKACYAANAKHCEVDLGPLFGAGLGVSVGLIGGQKARWRADLAMERDFITWPSKQQIMTDGELRMDATEYLTRFWLLAGIEI